ncbi:hypothetical protein ACQR16_35295 [Bradyrhizobium oligotrophicum]|uniref:hypothetical protein n=1 Tax=Bradyrhizobium oligotrophicum TaxID=44255 RepID=UPI003EBAF748
MVDDELAEPRPMSIFLVGWPAAMGRCMVIQLSVVFRILNALVARVSSRSPREAKNFPYET